jgi:hypothetical protein
VTKKVVGVFVRFRAPPDWKNKTAVIKHTKRKNQNILSLKTDAGISVSVVHIQIRWFCVLNEQCKN